jgi:hypothetical protein
MGMGMGMRVGLGGLGGLTQSQSQQAAPSQYNAQSQSQSQLDSVSLSGLTLPGLSQDSFVGDYKSHQGLASQDPMPLSQDSSFRGFNYSNP